jgi:diacylglycerol kinase family enzyme
VTTTGRGWLVVGSTSAGSSGRDLIEAVAGRLASDGPTEVAVTGDPAELDPILAACGDRVLVVVGGDGSAHVVADALRRADLLASTTVGFVPLGTANDFATHLGMSADPRTAADQLRQGRRRQLDLMEATPRGGDGPTAVVNAVHAGLGVIGARRAAPLKPVLGRFAYPVGVTTSGMVDQGRRIEVLVDDVPVDVEGPVLAVAVANAPRLGGVELVAGADSADGVLDVMVVPARPWRTRLGAVGQVLGRGGDAVHLAHGRRIELWGDVGELDADGEELAAPSGCRFEVRRGALRVLAPG